MEKQTATATALTVKAVALSSALIVVSGASNLPAERRVSGTETWQDREITYKLSGESRSDIRFSQDAREFRIGIVVDGVERTVILQDEDIDVDGESLDVGSYDSVSLHAERDFLILNLVTTRSWSASASSSESRRATTDGKTTVSANSSRSESSGKATDYHAFGFTDLNGKEVRFRGKGGRSVDCSIATGPGQRSIRFDVDQGKNEGTIVIQPAAVDINGVRKRVEKTGTLLVTATKRSLDVSAGGAKIWPDD